MQGQLVKLTLKVDVSLNVSADASAQLVDLITEYKATGDAPTEGIVAAGNKLHGDVPLDFLVQTVVGETLGVIIAECLTVHHAPPKELIQILKCTVQYEPTPDKVAPPADAVPVVVNVGKLH